MRKPKEPEFEMVAGTDPNGKPVIRVNAQHVTADMIKAIKRHFGERAVFTKVVTECDTNMQTCKK